MKGEGIMLAALASKWKWIAVAAAVAAAAWWHSERISTARQEGVKTGEANVHAQWAKAREQQQQAATEAARKNQQTKESQDAKVIDAQNQRASTSARHLADMRGIELERDRLRHALTTALNTIRRCDLSSAATDAAAERAAAVAAVLAEMERAGAEMARAASAHAADSLMYQQAWPR